MKRQGPQPGDGLRRSGGRASGDLEQRVRPARVVALLQVVHPLPHLALIAAGAHADGRSPAEAHVAGAPVPPTLLDAPDLEQVRLPRADQRRTGSRAVLLTAFEQLALQHERGPCAVVADHQLTDDG